MKKFLSMTMTLIMLMALAVPAFAVDKESDSNSEAEVQEEILESASEFAYLDADKATPELKEKILEARKEIIYNTDWVADGYVGCIRNIKTGKLIKELPEFSEVFPGWDVPIEENNAKIEISEPVLPAVPADNTMEEIIGTQENGPRKTGAMTFSEMECDDFDFAGAESVPMEGFGEGR